MAVAALAGVVALAVLLVILLVPVDRYRAEIERRVDERITGKLTLGKLTLGWWGQIRVAVDGLELADAQGHAIVSTHQVYLVVPVLGIIGGAPELTLRLDKPEINLVRDRAGRLNVAALIRQTAPPAAARPSAPATPPAPPASPALPGLLANARFSFKMSGARIHYIDEASGQTTELRDFEVAIRDLARNRPCGVDIRGAVDTRTASGLTVRGPIRFSSRSQVVESGAQITAVAGGLRLDLGGLEVASAATVYKKGGTALSAETEFRYAITSASLTGLVLQIGPAHLHGSVEASGLGSVPVFRARLDGKPGEVFGGSLGMEMSGELRPQAPVYQFHFDADRIDLGAALAQALPAFRDTLLGTARFQIEGKGAGFDPVSAQKALDAHGSFRVSPAEFATLDIGKMVADAIGQSVDRLSHQVPSLKGLKVPAPGSISAKYAEISSDFTLAHGELSAPNFSARSVHGIDVRGTTRIGLADRALHASWTLIDTYDVTGARQVSVEAGGLRIDHVLARGNSPVQFPIEVTGTLSAPRPSHAAVPGYFVQIALDNVAHQDRSKLKSAVQDQIDTMKASPEVKNALQGLSQKLFGK